MKACRPASCLPQPRTHRTHERHVVACVFHIRLSTTLTLAHTTASATVAASTAHGRIATARVLFASRVATAPRSVVEEAVQCSVCRACQKGVG